MHIRLPFHAALFRPAAQRVQELFHRVLHIVVALVQLGRAAGGERQNQFFAVQFVALAAVGEAVHEHVVYPAFHQAGHAVPEHGELHDDYIRRRQPCLFFGHVYRQVRISRVQMDKFGCGHQLVQSVPDDLVGEGFVKSRVR